MFSILLRLNLIILATVIALFRYLPNQKRFSARFVDIFSNLESITSLFLKTLFPVNSSFLHRIHKSLIYIIEELLSDLNDLPNNIKNSHLSSFEEPIFKCYSMLKLSNAKRLLDIKEDEFIYKELDEFLAQISDNLAQTSEELTKTYFSHNNE